MHCRACRLLIVSALAAGWLGVAAAARAQDEEAGPSLVVGDKAPPLKIARWVKGQSVAEFAPGKVFVVEFWATWCPPCRTSIPHLTELQKKFKEKGVTIVGVSSEDDAASVVPAFVEKMGEKMDYAVAIDDGRTTSRAWMDAAGQDGIPTAFVVSKDGRVAWIGHPMAELEQVLDDITAGRFDMEKAIAKAKHEVEVMKKAEPIMSALQQAGRDGKYETVVEKIDELMTLDQAMFSDWAFAKIQILLNELKKEEEAYAFAAKAADSFFRDNAQALNGVSWAILDSADLQKRDLALALRLALRAAELTESKDASILDTLARAHFQKGDLEKALAAQRKALSIEPPDGPMRQELEERLKQYEAAAAKE